jgi:hypothetical protein
LGFFEQAAIASAAVKAATMRMTRALEEMVMPGTPVLPDLGSRIRNPDAQAPADVLVNKPSDG